MTDPLTVQCILYRYAVTGNEEEWEKAVGSGATNIVSVKKKKRLGGDAVDDARAVKKKRPEKEKKKHKH